MMANSPNTPERNAAHQAASDATNARWKAEEIPTSLSLEVDGIARCRLFDVYFNGVKQTRCSYANAQTGMVTRYVTQIFGVPQRDRFGNYKTRHDCGTVVIVRKGEAP